MGVLTLLAALQWVLVAVAFDKWNVWLDHSDVLGDQWLQDTQLGLLALRIAEQEGRKLCILRPKSLKRDNAPMIMKTLNEVCREKSLVYMPGEVYNINSPMVTTNMVDVKIILTGRLQWSGNIDHWLRVSMPIGFQNQSTAWHFGGHNVLFDGFGIGTLDGNGQLWYNWAVSEGNLPHRPININFKGLSNSVIRGLRFVQSQMWTMAISHSRNLELSDIYVNSTSNSRWSTLNTDGCDTISSDNITFRRWWVANGDDAIALKGNSSFIYIYDSIFHGGQGIAIGSMGQFDGKYEYINNLYARNLTFVNTAHVAYLKTWAGVSRGVPPNGGGGGIGLATNITMEDIKIRRLRQQPFFCWQCENYSGWAGRDCNSSKFKMSRVTWKNVTGTVNKDVKDVGSFQCSSAAGGCDDFEVSDIDVWVDGGDKLDNWHCENVHGNKGFTCNDPPPQKSG
ncbi:hypothetical protein MHUMG1_03136 [Metarhizium humberi]|uniref:Pectin lyase fold protein n=1 Tax=Metarhizium humberi TaxID=2596975 RepID=A0A9P8MFK5_9HYPO|nr:hypothetical protein MHUMG1_03136 [Metarhizium humberi]